MKRSLSVRALAMFLALMMVAGIVPVTAMATEIDDAESLETSVPETSVPETTDPETTVPETTVPETTVPETTVPETTVPETTVPETTSPEEPDDAESEINSDAMILYVDGFVSETHEVFSHTESTIAPGVTQYINYAYAKDGKQMVYYVVTADLNRDDVILQTSYKDQFVNKEFGMEKLTAQIAFADKLYTDETSDRFISEYYKVVAGVNASFYNMTTGQPSGVTYLDGVQIGESSSYAQFFAVLKDGTPIIDYTKNLANYEGNIEQAVAGSEMLVWNGADVTASVSGSYNTDRHSRTCVGITADGKVVMMTLDGRQEPFSCGGTMHELAQIMLEAGCVAAINLDGGGSATFAARQEGEDKVTIVNRPSDGSERSISSGLIVASLTVPSDSFDRATLTAENEYVTPGSTVTVTAKGVSPAGTAAQIPENVTWQLADSTLGTVENGIFTSNGTSGDAVVQMVYEGNVVGETTIHVVVPETIIFNSAVITVPYGKSVTLDVTATYGLNEVTLKAGDVIFTLSDETLGTVDGFTFAASAETAGASSGTINAVLAFDASVTDTAEITLGKGSEVIRDFEDGTDAGMYFKDGGYNYVPAAAGVSVADASNGQVHSGEHSLRMNINYSNSLESGYQRNSLYLGQTLVLQNATSLGMWMYIPDEAVGLWARFVLYPVTSYNEDGTPAAYGSSITGQLIDGSINGQTGYVSTFQESGWHYISIDLSGYSDVAIRGDVPMMQFYISDRDGLETFGYDASNYANIPGDFTFYIDDLTVDYSSAVDDRDAPVFSSVVYADEFTNDAPELNGQTTTANTLSFTATVADKAANNASGIDASSVKAYVDGNVVNSTYSNGKVIIDGITLVDGVHTIKFSVCDQLGNYASVIRTINVQAGSAMSSVKVVPHDAAVDRILFGSLYYVDVVASNVEKIKSVTTTLDLNSLSDWELDHMEVAEGFKASYTINRDENIASITITRTGASSATGEAALVSMPIRAWQWGYTKFDNGNIWSYTNWKSSKEFWAIDVSVEIDQGLVTYTDGTTGSFSGNRVQADTEMWAEDADMLAQDTAYYNAWNGGHEHRTAYASYYGEETTNYTAPTALEDAAATCTTDGYTGRTYCETCKSIVDWGTTVSATGHSYEITDGVLKCSCGETYTGEYEGVTYVNGVAANGWVGDSYYAEGVKLTGMQLIDGYYYDLGEDGICAGQAKYTGFLELTDGWYYITVGQIAKGWQYIDGNYHYFDPETGLAWYGKEYYIYQQTYQFDEKGMVLEGLWVDRPEGTQYFYGPGAYKRTWAEIDGNTYYFDVDGFRKEGTCWFIAGSSNNPPTWYEFTEEGVLVRTFDETGLWSFDGKLYYLLNGVNQKGLFLVDGDYYYFNSTDYTAVSGRYWVGSTNGLDLPQGYYYFDETTHKMVLETEKNGLVEENGGLYYYVDGVLTYAGLIQIDGSYYYINSTCKAVTGRYWVEKNNGLMDKGFYEFGEDGKMIIETTDDGEVKNGLVEENGGLYYYVDGVLTYAGLIQIDGSYYYINSTCKAVTGTYWVSKNNGIMPSGFYDFAEDGKMIIETDEGGKVKNGLVEENGALYYYVDGVLNYAGLLQIDGYYYYINSTCKAVTGRYWVEKNNDLMPKGFYEFAQDGKMILDPVEESKNGLVEENGGLYYYVDGVLTYAGLIQIDGSYYYINSTCKAVTGRYWVQKNNELMPIGYYNFADDGKMIIG